MSINHTYIYKIADREMEFRQIHQLNHDTFASEIPQHGKREDQMLVDRFHEENTYLICLKDGKLIGMIAVRDERPFSLDEKIGQVEKLLPIKARKLCEVRLLAVKKQYRNGRVLIGLLRFLISHCLNQGYDAAVISATTRELKLYNQMGFVPFADLTGKDDAMFQPMYLEKQVYEKGLAKKTAHDSSCFLPGPISISNRVIEALNQPAISHRSHHFVKTMQEVREKLCQLTSARYAEVMLGSGTLANDAVAAQLSLQKGSGLILSNGEFGERLCDHARRFGLSFRTVEKDWGTAFSERDIVKHLTPETKWIWAVHCDTSTGVLNDIGMLQSLCAKNEVLLCLDCISTIGAIPIDLTGVHMATGVSGKAVGSLTGLSFIFHYSPLYPSDQIPRYLDLGSYFQNNSIPYSQTSNLISALSAALDETDAERYEQIAKTFDLIYRTVIQNGFRPVVDKTASSYVIVTIEFPDFLSSQTIGDLMRDQGYILHYESSYLLNRNWIQIACLNNNQEKVVHKMLATLTVVTEYERLHARQESSL
ncbi:MAG: aminotransferase class V-fold PLP-dependent enzyme [Bacillus sp. (in: firmicutes)]